MFGLISEIYLDKSFYCRYNDFVNRNGERKNGMNCLILENKQSDFCSVIESCGVNATYSTFENALYLDLSSFDSYIILACGKVLDPRLRIRLENEAAKGKRLFTEGLNSWDGIYSDEPANTTRMRLVAVASPEEGGIPGLSVGDLLDDGSNAMLRPWCTVPGYKPLLVYRDHIIAHKHWNAGKDEIMKDSFPALWKIGENVMMCSFVLHNYVRARFAPQKAWKCLIDYIAEWITGNKPSAYPEPPVRFCAEDLSDEKTFEKCRKEALDRGILWLSSFLTDGGKGGIKEGLRHEIDYNGVQKTADAVRNDCSGESAGAFLFYGTLSGNPEYLDYSKNLFEFIFDNMQIRGGLLDGMMRWTHTAWQVCYQDDVARAVLPALFNCLFLKNDEKLPNVCKALDFLVKTTAKDGCRVARTDGPQLSEEKIAELAKAEHGRPSAHYNAYYHAALLLAYKCCGNQTYYDVARRGLEYIMSLYPETGREQSETEEMCRLILPLAVLYYVSKDKKHLDMLHRVTEDLLAQKHPFGGFREWDTGYKAHYSRESRGECSLLAENGDPVADLLYSNNWLPLGFAFAYYATGEEKYFSLWSETVKFFINCQIISDDPKINGSWCRAFDMDSVEVYGCPHDIGWAPKCSETGWTDAEILMGMMLPDIIKKSGSDEK